MDAVNDAVNDAGRDDGVLAGAANGAAPDEALPGSVRAPTLDGEPVDGDERDWTTRLANVMSHTHDEIGARLHTTLSCGVRDGRPVLYLPPEMGALQPRSLTYLRAFSRRHGFGLIEDRRKVDVRPIVEQRDRTPSGLALGISLLLKQTGMPGSACTLSDPHRLAADSPHIALDELVRIAARARVRSKRVVMLPNRMIAEATGQDTHPVVGRACRVETAETSTVLSQFESPAFRCIGHSTGRQYVVHVFLAGGLGGSPELWTRLHTLARIGFRFRLFPGERPAHDFGLFHTTYHYDVAHGERSPWWLANAGGESPGSRGDESASEPEMAAHPRAGGRSTTTH